MCMLLKSISENVSTEKCLVLFNKEWIVNYSTMEGLNVHVIGKTIIWLDLSWLEVMANRQRANDTEIFSYQLNPAQ